MLVDEYDKPILDALEVPEVAKANRDYLRGLYGAIEDCDDDIRFRFITDVSKFSKVSLFSGLHSLRDITLDRRYFLIDVLDRRGVTALDLERMRGDEELLSKFDVEDIGTEALLYQTGHLTIEAEEEFGGTPEYRMGHPNREVKQSLNKWLLERTVRDPARRRWNLRRLQEAMEAAERAGLERVLGKIFIDLPHQWHAGSRSGTYEAYYASVVSTHFLALGFDVRLEDSSSARRTDMAVRHGGAAYVFEFKVDAAKGTALHQIKEKGYADKCLGEEGPVYLAGVECGSKTHNVEHLDSVRAL